MIKPSESVTYKVEGPSSYSVNLLTRAGVRVIKPRMSKDSCTFTVDGKDNKKAEQVLSANGRVYEVIKVDGAKTRLKKFFTKYAFIAGILVSFTAVGMYGATIGKVRVEGVERLDKSRVEAVCAEYVVAPCFRQNFDYEGLKNSVLAIDGVAYVGITEDGRDIVVKIVEELPKTIIEDTLTPDPLVAREEGVITKLAVYRGTAAVNVGDKVKEGDILVYPYVGSGEHGKKEVRAMGYAEARVTRTERLEYPSEEEYKARSATDVEACVARFKASLDKDSVFTGSHFCAERLDKSVVISIYYDIITKIAY